MIPAALLVALHSTPPRPEVCTAHRRNQWGRVVASCSFHPGHLNDHRDIHVGRTWT